jgi:hypothetical protein
MSPLRSAAPTRRSASGPGVKRGSSHGWTLRLWSGWTPTTTEPELLFAVECAEKNINLNAIGSDNAMALLDATTDRRAWWRRLLDSRWPK